jgi:molecular chaperone GrpE (heat shock protein)
MVQAQFQPGTYVRHTRHGPGRVVESLPDHVVVRERYGEIFRVNLALVAKELTEVPPDGFIALLYHRDVNSDYIRDNIEDVAIRLMRDRRRLSISVRDLRSELAPILARDGLRWPSWWKSARKNLSSAKRVISDPKKKGVFILPPDQGPTSQKDWTEKVDRANDSQTLLLFAHELELLNDSGNKEHYADLLADKTVTQLTVSESSANSYTECFLVLCRLIDAVGKAHAEKVHAALEKVDCERLSLSLEFDEDMQVALVKLGKHLPVKAATFAALCLKSGSRQVAVKAFGILNSEKNRPLLKQIFLDWLVSPGPSLTPNFDLFLGPDFVKRLRKEDVGKLYDKVLTLPTPSSVVKKFLNDSQVADIALSLRGEGSGLERAILSAKGITAEAKKHIVDANERPDLLLARLLNEFSPGVEAALIHCLARIQLRNGIECWPDLISVLGRGQTPSLARQLTVKIRDELEAKPGDVSLRLVEYAGDLHRTSIELYPDNVPILQESAKKTVSNLLNGPDTSSNALLRNALREKIEEITRLLTEEREKLRNESSDLKSRFEEAQREASRLTHLVDMLKSSASQTKDDLETTAMAEAIRPFLLLLDDFERQVKGSPQANLEDILNQLRAALGRAGVERIGMPGEFVTFDPSLHELLEEPKQSFSRVRVVRSGYRFLSQTRGLTIRRALVKADLAENA